MGGQSILEIHGVGLLLLWLLLWLLLMYVSHFAQVDIFFSLSEVLFCSRVVWFHCFCVNAAICCHHPSQRACTKKTFEWAY